MSSLRHSVTDVEQTVPEADLENLGEQAGGQSLMRSFAGQLLRGLGELHFSLE